MKERPILFKAEMVRALLDGRKTQTRRIVKPQPIPNHRGQFKFDTMTDDEGIESYWYIDPLWGPVRCPYGQPGDRLWVKETHLYVGPGSGSDLPDYVAEARNPVNHTPDNCWYRADGDDVDVTWKPSIHMFRGLSRILLEIVNVRVERLQDISEEDALAEGVSDGDWIEHKGKMTHFNVVVSKNAATAREAYCALFESINGSGSWDANPWVWVVEFRMEAA